MEKPVSMCGHAVCRQPCFHETDPASIALAPEPARQGSNVLDWSGINEPILPLNGITVRTEIGGVQRNQNAQALKPALRGGQNPCHPLWKLSLAKSCRAWAERCDLQACLPASAGIAPFALIAKPQRGNRMVLVVAASQFPHISERSRPNTGRGAPRVRRGVAQFIAGLPVAHLGQRVDRPAPATNK